MERCVFNKLFPYIVEDISSLQHGFMKNRSRVTQLLSVLHSIGQNLDKNFQTDVLYLDLAKAFDSVDHETLLKKLSRVTGPLLNWFGNYLPERHQRVVVAGIASRWTPLTSGVPQGSILGPLLFEFVIFISDLPDVIPCETHAAIYAYDTKIFRYILNVSDCESLQASLCNISTWCSSSKLRFNTSKCKVLTFTHKKCPIAYDYQLGSQTLTRVQEEKDLGIVLSSNLTWNGHVNCIIFKANKLLGLLKRTCSLLTDTKVRRSLYLSLVKSHLTYGSEI